MSSREARGWPIRWSKRESNMSVKRYLLMMILAVTLCIPCAARQALAQGSLTIDDASPQEIVDGMANKIARGVTNIATGWLELPKQIYTTCKEEGIARGL